MLDSEARKKYPELFFNTLAMDEKYPGGESPIENYNRVKESFEGLSNRALQNKNLNFLVVTHSGNINIIYHLIKNIPWTNRTPKFPIGNTSIHKIDYKAKGWKIIFENHLVHLRRKTKISKNLTLRI